MNTRYMEFTSSYRNRELYPNPSDFIIHFWSNTNQITALDPVCTSTPIIVFTDEFSTTPSLNISGTVLGPITTGIGASSTSSNFFVNFPAGLQTKHNFYSGAVITITHPIGPITESRQIAEYRNISNTVGEITLSIPFNNISDGESITIRSSIDVTVSPPTIFVSNGRLFDNAYKGLFLYNENKRNYRSITYYDGVTKLVTINDSPPVSTLPIPWQNTDVFSIRKTLPQIGTTINATLNNSTIELDNNTVSMNYIGDFIRIPDLNNPTTLGIIRKIVNYNSSTKIASVYPPFPFIIAPITNYEILPFSYDNAIPFSYSGSLVSQQDLVCYEVELVNLSLPNKLLTSGGKIVFYPYVYVRLSNVSAPCSGTKNIFYSNNPNTTNVLFRAITNDVTQTAISPFVKLNGGGVVQTIKFKPNDDLRFSVILPDGSLFITEEEYVFSPGIPEPTNQISALFAIKRL